MLHGSWPSFRNWNWDTERWPKKQKRTSYFLQYLSTQMDFQADSNCFQLQTMCSWMLFCHCVLPLFNNHKSSLKYPFFCAPSIWKSWIRPCFFFLHNSTHGIWIYLRTSRPLWQASEPPPPPKKKEPEGVLDPRNTPMRTCIAGNNIINPFWCRGVDPFFGWGGGGKSKKKFQ